jgi:oligopeptide transport system ATP-binding protein
MSSAAAASPSPAMEPPGSELLRVEDLKVWFPIKHGLIIDRHIGDVRAVDGVSLSLRKGETLGLVGESGCGKSTIARAIIRLYRPTEGRIIFEGTDISTTEGEALRRTRRRMQMVFQDPYASLNPRMNVETIIAEPLEIHRVGSARERRERARELLATVGLNPEFGVRYPHEFSGGQRQRIGVARALALNPDLVVADEPISALDVFGLTYLFVAHDLSVVAHISDRIAVMYLGRIVELAGTRDLNRHPLHPYSVALLSAIPIPDPAVESRRRRIILKGDVPSPVSPPPGCRFHTRCWLRERLGNPEVCSTVDPPLTEVASGHEVACHFADQVEGSKEQLLATGRGRPSTAGASTGSSAEPPAASADSASAAPEPPAPPAAPTGPQSR